MKIYSQITVIATLLIMLSGACKKDFLNVVPKGKQLAETTKDYELLLNGRDLYLYQVGAWQSMSLMGDDVSAEASMFALASVQSQNCFTWADDIYRQDDVPFDVRSFLLHLYTFNKVINEVMQSTGGTEQEKMAVRAEALANRAFINFQFINFYAKPYAAASAASDPGFPIIAQADINLGQPKRNSVQEVYDFIISDLTSAIAALPEQSATGSTRFNKAAAQGILGKVYLFMGRNTQALAQFNAALTNNAQATKPARLYNYNTEFPQIPPGQNVNDLTESVLARTFYIGPYGGNMLGNDFVVLSSKAQALFAPSDLRLKFFTPMFPYYQPNPSGRLSKINSANYAKFGLQLPELYLLRAEAKARTNNLEGAKEDAETLRKSRMPIADATVPLSIALNQTALIKFIMEERVREFAMEGYRWFDMRRCAVDPLFAGETYTHTLYKDTSAGNTTTYTLNSNRLTLRLPFYLTKSNPQLGNNP